MINVMVVGLKGELGYKTALKVIKNHNTKLIDFTLDKNNGTMKVGERTINLVPLKSHAMIIKETKPDIVVDFTSEFEDVFKEHAKLYIDNNISFIVGTVFPFGDNLNIDELVSGSRSSVLVIDNIFNEEVDFLAEIAIHAIKFLFNNPEKGRIFEDDAVLDLE